MIQELDWDSAFFGRKMGRLASVPSRDELRDMLQRAAAGGFAYLTCRLPADRVGDIQLLESHGFYLSDISLIWARRPDEGTTPEPGVRAASAADRDEIVRIAQGIFTDGRFYHDPFFSREEADRLYQAWAANLFNGLAERVFISDGGGFIGCSLSAGTGDIPLVGVAAGAQGRGLGTKLVRSALDWFRQQGAGEVTVRTQACNRRAAGLYEGCGFRLKEADVTMGRIMAGCTPGPPTIEARI